MKKRKNTQLGCIPFHIHKMKFIFQYLTINHLLFSRRIRKPTKRKRKRIKKKKKKRINPTHLSNHHNGTSKPHPDRDSLKATSGLNLCVQVRMYYLALFDLKPSFLLIVPLKTSTLSPLQYPCSCHNNSSLGWHPFLHSQYYSSSFNPPPSD